MKTDVPYGRVCEYLSKPNRNRRRVNWHVYEGLFLNHSVRLADMYVCMYVCVVCTNMYVCIY